MKSKIYAVTIVVNIILGIILIITLPGAISELQSEYSEPEAAWPDTVRMYLEHENYGVAACLARPIRGGAEITGEEADYYRLGEYADLLFLKEVFVKEGNMGSAELFGNRIDKIRKEMPEYTVIFDKIDQSERNAVGE